jgi:hypothetical protein
MAEFLPKVVSIDEHLEPGASHEIRFRPQKPGDISVRCQGIDLILHQNRGHRVDLIRPGVAQPVATKSVNDHQGPLSLRFPATQAHLQIEGDWVCRLTNISDSGGTFRGTVTFLSDIELHTATFDLDLLNHILSELVEIIGLKLKLETSNSIPLSELSWSWTITELLSDPEHAEKFSNYKQQLEEQVGGVLQPGGYKFHFPHIEVATPELIGEEDDFVSVGIRDLNLDNRSPRLSITNDTTGALEILIHLGFETQGVELVTVTDFVTGDIEHLSITVHVSLTGQSDVECDASGKADFTVGSMDISDRIRSAVVTKRSMLNRLVVQHGLSDRITGFITTLMRLDTTARIHQVRVEPRRLVVSYFHGFPMIVIPEPPVRG